MAKGLKYSQRLTKTGRNIWSFLKRPLASLVLTLGLTLAGASQLQVRAADLTLLSLPHVAVVSDTVVMPSSLTSDMWFASSVQSPASLPSDGIYLYGQSPEPNQVGYAYAVMEIVDNHAIGAFYMPDSSFDCFYGDVGSEALTLNVVSSYEQETYQYSLPVAATTVAATTTLSHPMQLSGYYDIETLSSNDHRILGVCRSMIQQQTY